MFGKVLNVNDKNCSFYTLISETAEGIRDFDQFLNNLNNKIVTSNQPVVFNNLKEGTIVSAKCSILGGKYFRGKVLNKINGESNLVDISFDDLDHTEYVEANQVINLPPTFEKTKLQVFVRSCSLFKSLKYIESTEVMSCILTQQTHDETLRVFKLGEPEENGNDDDDDTHIIDFLVSYNGKNVCLKTLLLKLYNQQMRKEHCHKEGKGYDAMEDILTQMKMSKEQYEVYLQEAKCTPKPLDTEVIENLIQQSLTNPSLHSKFKNTKSSAPNMEKTTLVIPPIKVPSTNSMYNRFVNKHSKSNSVNQYNDDQNNDNNDNNMNMNIRSNNNNRNNNNRYNNNNANSIKDNIRDGRDENFTVKCEEHFKKGAYVNEEVGVQAGYNKHHNANRGAHKNTERDSFSNGMNDRKNKDRDYHGRDASRKKKNCSEGYNGRFNNNDSSNNNNYKENNHKYNENNTKYNGNNNKYDNNNKYNNNNNKYNENNNDKSGKNERYSNKDNYKISKNNSKTVNNSSFNHSTKSGIPTTKNTHDNEAYHVNSNSNSNPNPNPNHSHNTEFKHLSENNTNDRRGFNDNKDGGLKRGDSAGDGGEWGKDGEWGNGGDRLPDEGMGDVRGCEGGDSDGVAQCRRDEVKGHVLDLTRVSDQMSVAEIEEKMKESQYGDTGLVGVLPSLIEQSYWQPALLSRLQPLFLSLHAHHEENISRAFQKFFSKKMKSIFSQPPCTSVSDFGIFLSCVFMYSFQWPHGLTGSSVNITVLNFIEFLYTKVISMESYMVHLEIVNKFLHSILQHYPISLNHACAYDGDMDDLDDDEYDDSGEEDRANINGLTSKGNNRENDSKGDYSDDKVGGDNNKDVNKVGDRHVNSENERFERPESKDRRGVVGGRLSLKPEVVKEMRYQVVDLLNGMKQFLFFSGAPFEIKDKLMQAISDVESGIRSDQKHKTSYLEGDLKNIDEYELTDKLKGSIKDLILDKLSPYDAISGVAIKVNDTAEAVLRVVRYEAQVISEENKVSGTSDANVVGNVLGEECHEDDENVVGVDKVVSSGEVIVYKDKCKNKKKNNKRFDTKQAEINYHHNNNTIIENKKCNQIGNDNNNNNIDLKRSKTENVDCYSTQKGSYSCLQKGEGNNGDVLEPKEEEDLHDDGDDVILVEEYTVKINEMSEEVRVCSPVELTKLTQFESKNLVKEDFEDGEINTHGQGFNNQMGTFIIRDKGDDEKNEDYLSEKVGKKKKEKKNKKKFISLNTYEEINNEACQAGRTRDSVNERNSYEETSTAAPKTNKSSNNNNNSRNSNNDETAGGSSGGFGTRRVCVKCGSTTHPTANCTQQTNLLF